MQLSYEWQQIWKGKDDYFEEHMSRNTVIHRELDAVT